MSKNLIPISASRRIRRMSGPPFRSPNFRLLGPLPVNGSGFFYWRKKNGLPDQGPVVFRGHSGKLHSRLNSVTSFDGGARRQTLIPWKIRFTLLVQFGIVCKNYFGAFIAQRKPKSPSRYPLCPQLRQEALSTSGLLSQDPPRKTCLVPISGPCGFSYGLDSRYSSLYQSRHHSHWLPAISKRP